MIRKEHSLKTRVLRKIQEISPEDWGRVFPKALENYYFFKTLDESDFGQFSFYYILVYDNGLLVGVTSCFLMDYPLDIAVQGRPKRWIDFIKKFAPNILNARTLICGLPMGQGRIGISPEADSRKVVKAICESMERIAREEKAKIIAFKDFNCDYRDLLDPLIDDGFSRIETLPFTDMEIDFASFQEYLKKLSSVSRSGLKRKFKEIDGKVKIDLEVSNSLDEKTLNEAHGLYLQTYHKQEMGIEKLPKAFFENISRNMPQQVKFFLWRIDKKPVAFAFCLVSEGYFIDYYLGFDYSVAYQYHLYSVRFRDMLEWCIKNGIKKYEMGVTAYEAKRRLGFDFIPMYIYAKSRNKLFNPAFKVTCRLLKPENFHPVFQEMRNSKG